MGGLAQLARALAWQARGRGFKSRILHCGYVAGKRIQKDENKENL